MGLVLALLGHKDEAVDVYRRCSQLDGSGLKDPRTHEATRISALFNLGRLYADDGQYQRAIDVYHEAIQRMPPHYQAQVRRVHQQSTARLAHLGGHYPRGVTTRVERFHRF